MFWHCNINIQWNRKYQTWCIKSINFNFSRIRANGTDLESVEFFSLIFLSKKKKKRNRQNKIIKISTKKTLMIPVRSNLNFLPFLSIDDNLPRSVYRKITTNNNARIYIYIYLEIPRILRSYRRKMKISSSSKKEEEEEEKNCIKLYRIPLLKKKGREKNQCFVGMTMLKWSQTVIKFNRPRFNYRLGHDKFHLENLG